MDNKESNPAGGNGEVRETSSADDAVFLTPSQAEKPPAARPRSKLTREEHLEIAPLICAVTNGVRDGIDWSSLTKAAPARQQYHRVRRLINLLRGDLDNLYGRSEGWPYTPPAAPPPDPGGRFNSRQYLEWLITTYFEPFLERIRGRVPVKILRDAERLEVALEKLRTCDFVGYQRKSRRKSHQGWKLVDGRWS